MSIGGLNADALTPIEDLSAKLQLACSNHDIFAVRACYDREGVPIALVDQNLYTWQEYFNQNDKTHWVFEKIVYMPLEQAQADKTINPKAILAMTEPQKMNGTVYESNLKVVGFMTISFKQGSSKVGTFQPVGIASDGTAKLAMSRPVK